MASTEEENQKLRRDLDALRSEFSELKRQLRNFQVADESGGGQLIWGQDKVVLRLNSLTPASAQLSS